MRKMSDKQRLDSLQKIIGLYTGKVICRWSENGRGFRLHETNRKGATTDIRKAIDKFLNANKLGKI